MDQLGAIETQLRKNPAMTVVASAPATDSDLMVRAMRSGIREFLPHHASLEDLAAAVSRLAWGDFMENADDLKKGATIAVYSGKGGLGATTVAVNTAQAMAEVDRGARVSLVDMVVGTGDLGTFLNLDAKNSISDLSSRAGGADASVVHSILTACPGGVWALPMSDDPSLEESIDAEAIRSAFSLLSTHFPTTIADLEHQISERTVAALDAADRILLVSHLSVLALRSTQRSLALFHRLGYEEDKICIVLNRFGAGDVLGVPDAEKLLQHEIFWSIPNDYATVEFAVTAGSPIIINAPETAIAKSYRALARKLSGTEHLEDVAPSRSSPIKGLGKFFSRSKKAPPPTGVVKGA